jgi:putative oxidoreductase
MLRELSLQRLFSTFANGLPGAGLMLQRFVTAAVLIYGAVTHLHAASQPGSVSLPIAGLPVIDVCIGLLLLFGLWTPVAGVIVASRELWIMLSGGDPWMCLVMATLGATIAMIGPGAWSIDARLFGRKQITRLR